MKRGFEAMSRCRKKLGSLPWFSLCCLSAPSSASFPKASLGTWLSEQHTPMVAHDEER